LDTILKHYQYIRLLIHIYIYDYGVVEIHIDKDSTWSTVSTLIQTMKDESQIVILTFDEDLSDVTSSINFISTNYADLINANHLNAIRELKLDVTTTENSTNSVLINSIVNTMFKNVTNKFPISIRHYNESGINTNYVSIDAQTYITANNLKSYLEQEVGYLRNTSSKSRMYYSLTDELKVSTSEWQSNIFNKMRSTINATASYSQDFVGELNNKDIIVVNYNNTQSDISISPASLISADAYDYTNKRVLQGSPTSEINISLDANSYAMVYFTNISKLEIDENDNVYLYSKNGRILETNTDYSAGSVNAFQFVTSTVNVEDARII